MLKQQHALMIIWVSCTQGNSCYLEWPAAGYTRRLPSEWTSPLLTARQTGGTWG